MTDPAQPLPDELASDRDFSRAVQRALATLPEVHRHTLLLRYVDGLSYAEAAASLGVSIGTVMSRLFNGRRKLLRALKDMGVETEGLEKELKA
jgi:RNA polymerase sigma-70 factor (ECF subfamily)